MRSPRKAKKEKEHMKYIIEIKIEGEHRVETDMNIYTMERIVRQDLEANRTLEEYKKSVKVRQVGP